VQIWIVEWHSRVCKSSWITKKGALEMPQHDALVTAIVLDQSLLRFDSSFHFFFNHNMAILSGQKSIQPLMRLESGVSLATIAT